MKKVNLMLTMLAVAGALCGCANTGKKAGKENAEEKDIIVLDTLTRDGLIALPIDKQTEVLGKVTPETKAELFRYKITEDLKSGSLDRKESALMKEMLELVSPKIYSDSTAREEFSAAAQAIAEKLKSECGWDEGKLFQYTGTVMTAAESDKFIEEARKKEAEWKSKGYTGE